MIHYDRSVSTSIQYPDPFTRCIEMAGILLDLLLYILYMVHNNCALPTDRIPIPDILVNLPIGQHMPFIGGRQIEDVKFLYP